MRAPSEQMVSLLKEPLLWNGAVAGLILLLGAGDLVANSCSSEIWPQGGRPKDSQQRGGTPIHSCLIFIPYTP